MADTPMSLADMILPDVFYRYTQLHSTSLTEFWQSGIVADLSGLIGDLGGTTVNLPFFNDLEGDDVVVSDTADLEIRKLTTGMDIAVRQYRAMVYGGTDLAADLAGADPMASILTNMSGKWARSMQKNLLSVVAGAMGSLAGEGTAKNTHDISGGAGAAAIADGFSMVDAVQKLGDHGSSLTAVAMHSATQSLFKKQDLIDFARDSQGGAPIAYYQGKRVIVDDNMPTSGSGANTIYTTYLFGPGAVGYAEKAPKVPVEVDRNPLRGGGLDYLVTRRQFSLHPRGVKWVGTPAADGKTPSNAELATAGNWTRVVDPKLVRIVAFKHKV